jgi:hypothetical protein
MNRFVVFMYPEYFCPNFNWHSPSSAQAVAYRKAVAMMAIKPSRTDGDLMKIPQVR